VRANSFRNNQARPQRLGGIVSLTPVRDRSGEGEEYFAISWHSPSGDLRWLSPKIPSEQAADIAARILTDFVGGTLRR
jgi:hypothetical protein